MHARFVKHLYVSVLLLIPSLHDCLVFPDAAGVVLRTSDDRVTLVVKGARKDLVLVTVQSLKLIACVA